MAGLLTKQVLVSGLAACLIGCAPVSYEVGEDPRKDSRLYEPLDSSFVHVNQVDLHLIETGQGDSVLFLHGFPYFAGSWQPLMMALSDRYHVMAIDQRGYGYSEKPTEQSMFALHLLVEDVRGVLEKRAKGQKRYLVGHDWGGVVAWAVAQRYPELVDRLVVVNAPPYNAFLSSLMKHPSQQQASSYVSKLDSGYVRVLYQLKGAALLWSDSMERLVSEGRLSKDFKDAFLAAWSKPGAANAAVQWYSANIPEFDSISEADFWPQSNEKSSVPSLLIWSLRDKAFTRETLEETKAWVEALQVVELDTDSHTPHLEDVEHTQALITTFLDQPDDI